MDPFGGLAVDEGMHDDRQGQDDQLGRVLVDGPLGVEGLGDVVAVEELLADPQAGDGGAG